MKKVFLLLLALVLCIGSSGCTTGTEAEPSTDSAENSLNASVDSSVDNSVDEPLLYSDSLPAADMGGRVFNILQRWFGYATESISFEGEVIWDNSAEEGAMSDINLAKKKVLDAVELKYNCEIVGEMSTKTPGEIRAFLSEDMLSGAPTIDFCFETYYYYSHLVQEGQLVDLNTLGIDFSAPWWDQNAVTDLSLDGKLYYGVGDINTYDNDGTGVILFNKDLYKANGGDPAELYALAANGDWTFDVFAEKIEGFGKDLNEDGVRYEDDRYGLLSDESRVYSHVVAAGERTIKKDANDCPVLAIDNEQIYNVYNDVVDLYCNTDDVLLYYRKYIGISDEEDYTLTAFKEGRGLFYMTSLMTAYQLEDMEDEFGILPVPKHSAAQDSYYHTVSTHTTSCVFVPKSKLADGEKGKQIGTVLDALAAYSKDYLTGEYYKKMLTRGDRVDTDSAPMLDIVLGTRTFDQGLVFAASWADPTALLMKTDKSLKERIDTQSAFIEQNITQSMEQIKTNNP